MTSLLIIVTRPREGDSDPYLQSRGGPEEIVQMEDSLCAQAGRLPRYPLSFEKEQR